MSALSPRHVILSDLSNVIPLLHANIRLNNLPLNDHLRFQHTAIDSTVQSYLPIGYSWGDETYETVNNFHLNTASSDNDLTMLKDDGDGSGTLDYSVGKNVNINYLFSQCDIAVASDVVYDPIGYDPLIKSLGAFFALPSPSIKDRVFIMAHRHRNPEDFK